mmetsp:Transcript_67250/g.160384  ORF Transcript_67250/g.160384 Transcript_67250/m.160384 type:complete len:238 (-) Transcript_67250:530-1243(-)
MGQVAALSDGFYTVGMSGLQRQHGHVVPVGVLVPAVRTAIQEHLQHCKGAPEGRHGRHGPPGVSNRMDISSTTQQQGHEIRTVSFSRTHQGEAPFGISSVRLGGCVEQNLHQGRTWIPLRCKACSESEESPAIPQQRLRVHTCLHQLHQSGEVQCVGSTLQLGLRPATQDIFSSRPLCQAHGMAVDSGTMLQKHGDQLLVAGRGCAAQQWDRSLGGGVEGHWTDLDVGIGTVRQQPP